MKWNLNFSYRSHIYRSVIAFLAGVVVLFMPYDALNSVVVMIGVFVLLAGLGSAVAAYRSSTSFFAGLSGTSSLVSIVLGIFCISRPELFVDIMLFVIGLVLSFVGLLQVISVRQISRDFKRSAFYYPGGIATLLAGLFLIFFPKSAVDIIGLVLGLVLIVYALNEAGISFRLHNINKEERKVEDIAYEEIS